MKEQFRVTLPIDGVRAAYIEAEASIPPPLSEERKRKIIAEIKTLLDQKRVKIVAHYYTDPDIQALAEATGGCVADSLEMARFGRDCDADHLIVAGVKFMGETAKILSPEKRIFMPDLEANCSLDIGCPAEEFGKFCDQYPDHTVVVYANTSAEVKARADWVVTSAIGLEIVRALHEQGEKIVWGPDQHLGRYIQQETGADMKIWQGNCIVHHEFKGAELALLKEQYPEAKVLVHPESPSAVVEQADIVGSTSQLIRAAQSVPERELIVATDRGIFYKMQQAVPDKVLHIAPTAGESAACKSCASCPWMAMNTLEKLLNALKGEGNLHEIHLDESIRKEAKKSLDRMLDFAESRAINVRASGDLAKDQALFANVGAV